MSNILGSPPSTIHCSTVQFILRYASEDELMLFLTIYSQIGLQHRPHYLLFSLSNTLGQTGKAKYS